MPIKEELTKLTKIDIWSLMLFVLYNFQKIPEYSGISELAYILDQKNLLKLCEYFGGQTIRIPTIDELRTMLYALLLYQYVNIEKIPEGDAIELLRVEGPTIKLIKESYVQVKDILSKYQFSNREAI